MNTLCILAVGLLVISGVFAAGPEENYNTTMSSEGDGEMTSSEEEDYEMKEKMMKMKEKMKGEMMEMMMGMKEKMMEHMDDDEMLMKDPCMHARQGLYLMTHGVEMMEDMMEKVKRKAKNVIGCKEKQLGCSREDNEDRRRPRGGRMMGRY